jgi:hypothetical protein
MPTPAPASEQEESEEEQQEQDTCHLDDGAQGRVWWQGWSFVCTVVLGWLVPGGDCSDLMGGACKQNIRARSVVSPSDKRAHVVQRIAGCTLMP